MVTPSLLSGILVTHWVADFVCQTRWMGDNKSKNFLALAAHVLVYTAILFVVSIILLGPELGYYYAITNGLLHSATDTFTSRATASLYKKGWMHAFWCVIGLDQLIHNLCLIWTLWIVVGW